MGKNSDNLAAQLEDLKIAGHKQLPGVARHYSQASRHLHNVGFYGGTRAPALAEIGQLRDVIQDCMASTYQILIDNGKALVSIADQYAKTDQEAARLLAMKMEAWELSNPYEKLQLPMPDPKTSETEGYDVVERTVKAPDPNNPGGQIEVTIKEPAP